MMIRVKAVFNPENLLNPGKIFPSRRGCTEAGPPHATSTKDFARRVEAVLSPIHRETAS